LFVAAAILAAVEGGILPPGPALEVPRLREFARKFRRAGCPTQRQPGWLPLQVTNNSEVRVWIHAGQFFSSFPADNSLESAWPQRGEGASGAGDLIGMSTIQSGLIL